MAEPEPEEELKLAAGQKIDGFVKARLKDHDETSELGLSGPSIRGQLLKRSQHVKEWRSRYFILRDRKIFYYENEEEATPHQNGGKTFHKGYIDLVGCSVETFEDVDEGVTYYGFLVTEELPHPDEPTAPLRLCSGMQTQRDEWVDTIQFASRPTWIADKDPKAATCMVSGSKFGLKTRKSHCRRCGGVMCKKATALMELPGLQYEGPQKVCTHCKEGQPASRHIEKLPKSQRSQKKPKALDSAADAAMGGAKKLFGKLKGKGDDEDAGKKKKK